jgi:hypothetical protein
VASCEHSSRERVIAQRPTRTLKIVSLALHNGFREIHTACDCGQNVCDSIEEEEFGCRGRLDEHDDAGSDHSQETDDVQPTDTIENDVAWTSKRFWRESHLTYVLLFRRGAFLEECRYPLDLLAFDWDVEQSGRSGQS